jgi:methyl coenzyme M reductase subunit D
MNKCQNPECGKEIPEGKAYCDENCLKRHTELKIQSKKERHIYDTSQGDVWLGQERRKITMDIIKQIARECLPIPYKQFACIVSYRTGLSLRKITDDYLEVLIRIGFLKRNENMLLVLGENE